MSNNGDNKFTIDCPHCGQRFSVTVPKAELWNTGKLSAVAVTHEKPVKCICGGACVLAIQGAQISWAIVPITEQQATKLDGSQIIVPPEGVRLIG